MDNALAMIEFNTVSSGIRGLDTITKTADVEILLAQTVCPGKYMILFHGGLSDVKASLEAAAGGQPEHEIDRMLLGNPSGSLLRALYGTTSVPDGPAEGAVGVIETYSGASAVWAADTAAKAARVALTEIRLSRGMCGKSYAMLTGGLAEVTAALEAARKALADTGMFLDTALIARPDDKMRAAILS